MHDRPGPPCLCCGWLAAQHALAVPRSLLALVLVGLIAACTPMPAAPPPDANAAITYAVVEGVPLDLDVYLPLSDEPHPTVILVHGGEWQTGDKSDMAALAEKITQWGYVVFSINYRLAPAYPFPASVADVQCAVAWVREHAAEYGSDSRHMALVGSEAGGHLAMLAGLAAAPTAPPAVWQPACGEAATDVRAQAIVSISAPLDLMYYAQENNRTVTNATVLLGVPCQAATDVCTSASPITYVTADAPPTLLIHGTTDHSVSHENSERMRAALQSVGAAVTYLPIAGAQHNFILHLDTPEAQAAVEAIRVFLEALGPPPAARSPAAVPRGAAPG